MLVGFVADWNSYESPLPLPETNCAAQTSHNCKSVVIPVRRKAHDVLERELIIVGT